MKLDPTRTAVIAVHLQRDIVGSDGGLTDMFRDQVHERDVLSVAQRVLDTARTAGALVVYTRVAFAPDFSDMRANSPLLAGTAAGNCLVEGTPGAEIVAEVAPAPGDLIHTHKRIGAFAGTDLDTQLRDRGIEELLFVGVATNASLETSARWASDLGFTVGVIDDACAAATAAAHRASIDSMGMIGSILHSADITAAWETGR